MDKMRVNWEGEHFSNHSFAIVNRHICSHIQQNEQIDLRKAITNIEKSLAFNLKKEELKSFIPFTKPDLTISHQWPPDWSERKNGRWVCMQPWEFGMIPREWYIPMKYWVDEVWVNSSHTKEGYVKSGIPDTKIHVIPLGVDEQVFNMDVESMKMESSSFRFLFVGGTIGRKGIDVLLTAYLNEFSRNDDVCLYIKDTGTESFYKGLTLEQKILEVMADPDNPRIIYMDRHFSDSDLAAMYRACDCLVHPYRGEGFGLPIIEAMACGTSVIVPDKGASSDFCTEETAFLVKSEEVTLTEQKVGNLDTVDHPYWLSIDSKELQKVMRTVFENQALSREKGRQASKHILSSFTWRNCSQHVSNRIGELLKEKPNEKITDDEIVDVELRLANNLYKENRADEALNIYLNILAIYPSAHMARYNTAMVYIEHDQLNQAIGHLEYLSRMIEQDSDFQEKISRILKFCNFKRK